MTKISTTFQNELEPGLRRYLALGRHHADLVTAIRNGGLETAEAAAKQMGGVNQVSSVARGLLAIARRGDVAAKSLEHDTRYGRNDVVLSIPRLTWEHRGRRQVAALQWTPVHVFRRRRPAA